jgi:hypothetical protein
MSKGWKNCWKSEGGLCMMLVRRGHAARKTQGMIWTWTPWFFGLETCGNWQDKILMHWLLPRRFQIKFEESPVRLRSRHGNGHKEAQETQKKGGWVFAPLRRAIASQLCGYPSDAEQVQGGSFRNAKWREVEM